MAGWNLPPRRKWHVSRVWYWPLLLAVRVGHPTDLIITSAWVRGHPCNWACEEPLSLQPWPLCIWATEQDSGWGWLTFLGKSPCLRGLRAFIIANMLCWAFIWSTMYSHSLAIPRGPTTYYSSQTFLSPVLQIIFFPSSWTPDNVEPYQGHSPSKQSEQLRYTNLQGRFYFCTVFLGSPLCGAGMLQQYASCWCPNVMQSCTSIDPLLSKDIHPHQFGERTWKEQKAKGGFSSFWAGTSIFSYPQTFGLWCWFLGLWTPGFIPAPLVLVLRIWTELYHWLLPVL